MVLRCRKGQQRFMNLGKEQSKLSGSLSSSLFCSRGIRVEWTLKSAVIPIARAFSPFGVRDESMYVRKSLTAPCVITAGDYFAQTRRKHTRVLCARTRKGDAKTRLLDEHESDENRWSRI